MSQIPEINPEGWSELPVESVGYPQQGYQQQYPQQQQPQQPAPGRFAPAESENVPVMSEFDHLFRDSDPDSRRSVAQPSSPMVRAVGDQAALVQPARYPALNPVPPQWPAPVPGQAAALDPGPPQSQYALPAQYPVEPQPQLQAPAQQQYNQQQQPEQLYDQYQPEAQQYEQQQYNQQQYNQTQVLQQQVDSQYDQTTYLPQSQPHSQPQPGYQPGYSGPVSYGPGGPGNGSGEQQWLGPGPGGGGGKSKRTPALIGAGIAVIAVIGLVIALTGGGSGAVKKQNPVADSTPTPTLSAAQQAQKLSAIVAQSGQLRDDAIRAVDDLSSSSCSSLSQDQTSLEATAKARSAQATAVAALNVSKLPQGTQLVSDLSQAWQASATSDQAYATIAGDLAASNTTDCKSSWKKDANFPAADQADGEATRDKTAAAALWNDNLTVAPISQATISASQL